MPIHFLASALLIISGVTSLTTEGVKKLLDEKQIKYSSNLLAAVISVFAAIIVSLFYLVFTDTEITAKVCVEVLALIYGGFLIATVGYDKVMQTFGQIAKTDGKGNSSEDK